MTPYLDKDSHRNLPQTREQESAIIEVEREIKKCDDCSPQNICESHREHWEYVNNSDNFR